MHQLIRTRWAAIGAAVAVTLGAGGIGMVSATVSSGSRPILVPIEPCRLLDTRPAPDNIGDRNTPLGTDPVAFTAHGVHGKCDIPADAVALSLNVTGLNATAPTNVRVYPSDAATPPATSNLNLLPGQVPTPNAVTTDLDTDGKFTMLNAFGTTDVIVDINGYYEDHNHDDRYDDVQADIDGGNLSEPVAAADEVLRTVTVQTPTSGYVLASASVTLYDSTSDGTRSAARCSITSGTSLDTNALQWAYAEDPNARQTIALTRGVGVNKAFFLPGSNEMTLNLVCDGVGGTPVLEDAYLTAAFVPDPDAFGIIVVGP